ncbi:MAG TPA: sulfite exporter TauE/SafE family protein [Chloroflexota bacterium]|nr:sulfite exporter TauE/SafE family protein [Chloroflexota bacterium]
MKRLFLALIVVVAALAPTIASAHPLGNFTVNHYTRIEPAGDRVRLVYVLDMAEIPTFQERPRITDPEQYASQRAEEIRQKLHLTLNGAAAALQLEQRALSFPEGQGGLSTLRLEAVYSAQLVGGAADVVGLSFRDDNDPNRIGWREIVARSGAAGTTIEQASVPAEDVTNELRQYPGDLLNSPLNVREAQVRLVPGAAAARPLLTPSGMGVLDRTRGAFAELANNGSELTPTFVLFALGVAVVLGAAHSLQPGHGKTVVAAYLVGSRGTAWHALFLGATVTATHTAGVYALGLVTLFLSQYILPERLYPILEITSGVLVVAIGVWLFGRRLLAAIGLRREHGHHHYAHDHDHTHNHDYGHMHSHSHPHGPVGFKSLLALGISGGLLPCPEALMVLLITIAAHRVLFGLLLIVAFSTGLASVLVGFGLLLVFARSLFQRVNVTRGFVPRVLPVASAAVIVVAGFVITAQALPHQVP